MTFFSKFEKGLMRNPPPPRPKKSHVEKCIIEISPEVIVDTEKLENKMVEESTSKKSRNSNSSASNKSRNSKSSASKKSLNSKSCLSEKSLNSNSWFSDISEELSLIANQDTRREQEYLIEVPDVNEEISLIENYQVEEMKSFEEINFIYKKNKRSTKKSLNEVLNVYRKAAQKSLDDYAKEYLSDDEKSINMVHPCKMKEINHVFDLSKDDMSNRIHRSS